MNRHNVILMTVFRTVTTDPIKLASLARKIGNNPSNFELKGYTLLSI